LRDALLPILIDSETARSITGGVRICSVACSDEEFSDKEGRKCKFVDKSRF